MMATLEEYLARDKLADIAKGRYSKKRVEEMFKAAVMAACQETERLAAEFWCYSFLQDLHYELGFGEKRMARLMSGIDEKAAAFDAGAYDLEDMKNAIEEDTGFTLEFKWRE